MSNKRGDITTDITEIESSEATITIICQHIRYLKNIDKFLQMLNVPRLNRKKLKI